MQHYMGFKHAFFLTPLTVGLAAFFVTPHPVLGQNHDLVMLPPVSVTPDPLERGCPNSLSTRFRINGTNDFMIASQQVKIRFHYSDGSAGPPAFPSPAWTLIGELNVTYYPSDGPFAIGRIWPDDFASAAGAAFSWRPPSSPTSFHVRAEVAYLDPAIVDANPGDNSTVTLFSSVAGSCPLPPGCMVWASTNLIVCIAPGKLFDPRILPCLRKPYPLKPCWPLKPFPPICKFVRCPPCLTGLTCPPDPFELLFDNRANDLRIILVTQEGKEVARMETLRRPIRVGRQTFNQRLQFSPERGVSYYLKVLPGEKTRMDVGHKLQLHLRGGKQPMGKGGRY